MFHLIWIVTCSLYLGQRDWISLEELSRRKKQYLRSLQSTWTYAICSHINIHHPTHSKQHQHTLASRTAEHISRRITEHARSSSQPLRSQWYLKWSIINPSVTVIHSAVLNNKCSSTGQTSTFFPQGPINISSKSNFLCICLSILLYLSITYIIKYLLIQ